MNWTDFTTTTAPWWFVALLAGTLTVASTILGSVISVRSAAASDRRRAELDAQKDTATAQKEWRQMLRQHASNFIVETRQFAKHAQSQFVRTPQATGEQAWVRRTDQEAPDIRAAYRAYWELVLIADAETSRLSRTLMRKTREFDFAGNEPPRAIPDREWTQFRAAVVSARGSLVEHILEHASPID